MDEETALLSHEDIQRPGQSCCPSCRLICCSCSFSCQATLLCLAKWLFIVAGYSYILFLFVLLRHLESWETESGRVYLAVFAALQLPFLLLTFMVELFTYRFNSFNAWWSLIRHSYFTMWHSVITVSWSVITLVMSCFTIFTRKAYYHLNPENTIGPRFVIFSLQGSIVVILWAFFLQRKFKVKKILKDKDLISRAIFDFVDIFNLAELLSPDQCIGVGSFVSENSHTERAIQAFCTMSFFIVFGSFVAALGEDHDYMEQQGGLRRASIFWVHSLSVLFQNIPFLVIRIIVWAEYRLYSLGFLAKNVMAIVVCVAQMVDRIPWVAEDSLHCFHRARGYLYRFQQSFCRC